MVDSGEAEGGAELGASPRFKHTTPNAMTVALLKDAASRAAYVRSEIAALKAAQRAFPPPLVSPGSDSPAKRNAAPAPQGPQTSRSFAQPQVSPGPAAKLNRSHDSVIPHQKKPLQPSPLQWRKVATARHREPWRPVQDSSARAASHIQQQQQRSSAPSFSAAPSPPPTHTQSQVKAQVLERMKNVNAAMSKISKKKSRSKSARGPRTTESPPGWESQRDAERTRDDDEGDLRGLDGPEATLRGGFLGSPPPSLHHSLQHDEGRGGAAEQHRDALDFAPLRAGPLTAGPEEHHYHRQPQGGSGARGPVPEPLSPPKPTASPPLQGSPGGAAVPQTFISVSTLLNSSLEDAAADHHPHGAAGTKTKRKKKRPTGAAGAAGGAAAGPHHEQQQHQQQQQQKQQPKPRKPKPVSGRATGSKGSSAAAARAPQVPQQQSRRPAAAASSTSHPIARNRATPTKKRANGSKGRSSRKGSAAERSLTPVGSGLSPWRTVEPDSGGKLDLDVDPVGHLLQTVDRKILLEGAEEEEERRRQRQRPGAVSPDDPFYTWDPEELAMELGGDATGPSRGPAPAGWKEKARASVVDAGPSESCSSPGADSAGSSSGTPRASSSAAAAAAKSIKEQDGHTAPYALDEENDGNTISSVAAGSPGGGSDDAVVGGASATPAPSTNSDPDPFMVSPGSLPIAFRSLPGPDRPDGPTVGPSSATAPQAAAGAASSSPSRLLATLDDEEHGADNEVKQECEDGSSPVRPRALLLNAADSAAAPSESVGSRASPMVSSILVGCSAPLSTLSVDDVLREVAKGTRMGKRKELGGAPVAPKRSSLARRISSNFSAKGSGGSTGGRGSTRYLQLVLDRRSALLAYRRGALMGTNHGYVASVDARKGPWEPSSEISVETDSFLFHLVPSCARDYCVWILGLNVALHYVDGADPDLSSAAIDTPLHPRLRTAMPIDSLSKWASSGKK